MRFPLTFALALALLAAAVVPGAASASTVIVRPNGTTLIQPPWAVAPPGPAADVTLADAVTQPAAPSLAGATLTANSGLDGSVKVTLPTPSLKAGATPSAVTVWLYASVGAGQALTGTLSSGATTLGLSLSLIPGPATWHSFKLSPVPPVAQLSQLVLALRTNGMALGAPTKVYAAYVQVDVTDAAGPAGLAGLLPSGGAQPAGSGGSTSGDDSGDDGSGSADDPSGTSDAVSAATVSGPSTIQLPANATAVPVQVACPADQGGPCRGRIHMELAPAAKTRTTKARARAARCARGCRVIGDTSFTVAAGKKAPVRVRLRPAAFKMLPRGRTVKARVTVTSRDQSGRLTTVTRAIAIHRARY